MVIGRGRRREHPNQHCLLLLLRVLRNLRLRPPKIRRACAPPLKFAKHMLYNVN